MTRNTLEARLTRLEQRLSPDDPRHFVGVPALEWPAAALRRLLDGDHDLTGDEMRIISEVFERDAPDGATDEEDFLLSDET